MSAKAAGELTPKQQRFVDEYLVDLNATQAAIRAGYSPRTANEQAAQLLAKLSISSAVKAAIDARSVRTGVTADRVLQELERIGFSDMRTFTAWGASGVRLHDSGDLPEDATRCVAEVSETTTKDGGSVKFKLHDKRGALELIGKHLGIFPDRKELTGKDGTPLIPLGAIRELLAEDE